MIEHLGGKEFTDSLAKDLGLRQQPTNSRTSSKDVDPSLTTIKKKLKVKKNEDGFNYFREIENLQKNLEVPDRDKLSKSLQEQGMSKEEADKEKKTS